ncbi:hypothetical protein P152DRAFT_460590 [Eremomyces bilateralis CBS 781.70]|uniref:Uncharacterized protein n=1 Tax=Eremomyces bilateralis CBS 781.70 TaxID=1392243 RepID=A0A6G1FXS0_9PEZI|nr:uncharacterized protein P152DRAFT_460590 [Eremomyces bilateralis CBS 781.70]KAF1810466.1 hypothetical protein P152DRAFT_460590 [Eremomyces bilateralis CBS 781.70]
MGWLWGSKADDSAVSIDKELQEVLRQEAPKPTLPVPSSKPRPQQPPEAPQNDENTSRVNTKSLFPDGRYDHLWKTYRPIDEVEHGQRTHNEVLRDLVDDMKDRKRQVADAAKENCIFEVLATNDCWANGGLQSRITMCSDETNRQARCIELQKKFLYALGFYSYYDRPRDEMDRLQIHADRLYRQMMEHEKIIEDARAQNEPLPELPPVMSRENVTSVFKEVAKSSKDPNRTAEGVPSIEWIFENSPKMVREEYERSIQDKSPEEVALMQRELEGKEFYKRHSRGDVSDIYRYEREARAERKEKGKTYFGDFILNWGGFNSAEGKPGTRESSDSAGKQ